MRTSRSLFYIFHVAAAVAVTAACLPAIGAQTASIFSPVSASVLPASVPVMGEPAYSTSEAGLPDAPTSSLIESSSRISAPVRSGFAPRYARIVLPGLFTQPLTGGQKVVFAFRHAATPFNLVSSTFASAYSQAIDSAPHYGQGWGPFGQRYGAAVGRGTVQILAADGIFSPIFHDDPRYYELGPEHSVRDRMVYAATRVVITRSDAGKQRINLPLLSGYAIAAGVNNTFYPQQDRTAKQSAEAYGGSLAGAALGFLSNEFLDDALRAVHLRQ